MTPTSFRSELIAQRPQARHGFTTQTSPIFIRVDESLDQLGLYKIVIELIY